MKGDQDYSSDASSSSSTSNNRRNSGNEATMSGGSMSLFPPALADLPGLTIDSSFLHHLSRRQRHTTPSFPCCDGSPRSSRLCDCCLSRRDRVIATIDAVERLLREDTQDPNSPFYDPLSGGTPSNSSNHSSTSSVMSYKRANSSSRGDEGGDKFARQ